MANEYPANVKMYKDGQCKSFSNILSHTLSDDETPGADKGRGVNLIDQALANGWWWNREGKAVDHRGDDMRAPVPQEAVDAAAVEFASRRAAIAAALEPADVAPVSIAVIVEEQTAIAEGLIPEPSPEPPKKPTRSSKR